MKHGFTLIELMLGFGISALLMTLLFQNFSVINRVVRRADDLIDVDMISATLYNQLERDLSGACVLPQKQASSQEKTNAENKKEDPFVAKTKDGMFELLTFMTVNPLQVYPFAKNVKPQPRVARVAYILEPQGSKKNRYTLVRKESTENLEYKDFKSIRGFELARNIVGFKVTFRYTQESNSADAQTKRQKVEQWPMPDKEGKKPPAMPEYVTIKVTLTDERGMREQTFTFGFTLYGFNALSRSTSLTPTTTQTDTKTTGTNTAGQKQQTNTILDKLNAQAGKQQQTAPGQKVALLEGFHAPVSSKPPVEAKKEKVVQQTSQHGFNMDEFEKILKELGQDYV